jgi:hypothetical protein
MINVWKAVKRGLEGDMLTVVKLLGDAVSAKPVTVTAKLDRYEHWRQ